MPLMFFIVLVEDKNRSTVPYFFFDYTKVYGVSLC